MRFTFFIFCAIICQSCSEIKSDKKSNQSEKVEISIDVKNGSKQDSVTQKTENPNASVAESNSYIYDSEIPFSHNATSEIGIINDPDGYSNLREERHSKSKILKQIKQNDYFFYQPDSNLNWLKVKDLKGNIGFLHKSRIVKVENGDLFKIAVFNSYSRSEQKKDTIIHLTHLKDFFGIDNPETEFIYKKLKPQGNKVSYKDTVAIYYDSETRTSIKFLKSKFKSEEYDIEYENDSKFTKSIDGLEIWGTDGGLPTHKIENIIINEDGESYTIPNSKIKNIFQPNLTERQIEIFKPNDGRLIIQMHNSDGAGAYSVIFIIKDKKFLKRIVYINF